MLPKLESWSLFKNKVKINYVHVCVLLRVKFACYFLLNFLSNII